MNTMQIETVYEDAKLCVLALVTVETSHFCNAVGGYLIGKVEPVTIVVCDDTGAFALEMSGHPTNIDELRESYTELDLRLAQKGIKRSVAGYS